ncbi:unnamed protein product [Rhizoctonia solani]|uniref:Uncharacterized protein n=1 Tax=Rhizoctonia solani TaxID=456999 RepID=A0A8H2ZVD6_9AGAM|nr:unnamed protein product [Rhizoctonia solani]
MIFTTGLVVAAAVVGSSAQSLTSLSASCQAAAATVLTGPGAECLGISGLVNIAMTSSNDSLITPINNWLTTTCAQPACTNATIDTVLSNITSGCSNDLNSAGVTTGTWEDITDYVKEWYPVGRQVACLKNGNSFCVTTTLQAIENWVGQPLSKNTIQTVLPRLVSTTTEVPTNLTCTDCTKAAYALIRPHLNDANRGTWDNTATGQCGSTYADGTTPSGIIESANSATQGSSNGAVSSIGSWSATALLVGVASLAVLAF